MSLSYKELENKCENLKLELEQLKQDFYFDMRNKQMEIEVLKNKLQEVKDDYYRIVD
jgi:ribosomal protein L29